MGGNGFCNDIIDTVDNCFSALAENKNFEEVIISRSPKEFINFFGERLFVLAI